MTDIQIRPAPVRKSITVRVGQARAFELFTTGMGSWWPKAHSLNKGSPQKDVIVEPRAGGRWYETGEDGSECTWGGVRLWQPPERVVLIWSLGADWVYDPKIETEVEVRFTAQGEGLTRVDLEHRGLEAYGERAAEIRALFDKQDAWMGGLELFAAAVEGR